MSGEAVSGKAVSGEQGGVVMMLGAVPRLELARTSRPVLNALPLTALLLTAYSFTAHRLLAMMSRH